MILVLIAAIPLSRIITRARQQRQAVTTILAHHGSVVYDWQNRNPNQPLLPSRLTPSGPGWLRRWLGDEYFQEVTEVAMTRPVTPATLAAVGRLDRLKVLALTYIGKSSDDLTPLAQLTQLESLTLRGYGLNDGSLIPLSRLTKLRTLQIQTTWLTDAGLAPLEALKGLTRLEIGYSELIKSPGMIRLITALPNLAELSLRYTAVDDEVVDAIVALPALKNQSVEGEQISADGTNRLHGARPSPK